MTLSDLPLFAVHSIETTRSTLRDCSVMPQF